MTHLKTKRTGPDEGRPVMLMHALAANSTFWDDFCVAAGPDFLFVAFDQRGFGASPVPPRLWTVEDHVADIEQVRRQQGLERFAMVGTAVGGMLAMFYAATFPERVDSIVFTNPALGVTRHNSMMRLEKMWAGGGMAAIADDAVGRAFGELPRDERYQRYYDGIFLRNDPRGYEMTVLGMVDRSVEEVVGRVSCPVMLIGGGLDMITPPDGVARKLHAAMPNSRLEIVPDAGHLGPYQRPAAFADLAAPFLREAL